VLHVRDLPSGWLGKLQCHGGLGLNKIETTGSCSLTLNCVFHPDSLRRAIYYATTTAVDHLVLFPTAHMKTLGERMMIAFPQVMSSFAMRPWKVRDPKARDHVGVWRVQPYPSFRLARPSAPTRSCVWKWWNDLKLGENHQEKPVCGRCRLWP